MKTNARVQILVTSVVLVFSTTTRSAVVFSDDMSGTYSANWTAVVISGSGTAGFSSGELALNPNATTTELSAQTQTSLFGSPYSSVLQNNSGNVTWAINMRTVGALSGTDNQMAFVLGASSSDLTTANGYAVFVGNAGTPDPFQLVRFAGGLANGTRTVIAMGGDLGNTGTTRGSIRVVFDPSTSGWNLYGVSSGSFVDPTTVTTLLGSGIDSTYVNVDLSTLALWGKLTSSAGRDFDNLSIDVTPVPEPTNVALGIFALSLLGISGMHVLHQRQRKHRNLLETAPL